MDEFFVNETKNCNWDDNLILSFKESLEFIDDQYFEKKYKTLKRQYSNVENRNIILKEIVLNCGLALESLFSLLCGFVQAGYSYHLWICLYKNHELLEIVKKITNTNYIPNKLNLNSVSWWEISNYFFGKREETKELIEIYSKIWRNLSAYLCDQHRINAYNRIKHGFSASSNAITELKIGNEEKGITLKGSESGSHFVVVEKLENTKGHYIWKEQFVNYDVKYLLDVIHICSYSIMTIKSIMTVLTDRTKTHEVNIFFIKQKYVDKVMEMNHEGIQSMTIQKRTVNYPTPLPDIK